MALRPGDLQGLIAQRGHPYAFHLPGDPENASSILRSGLIPWDHPENPQGAEYGGYLRPRPGHTYMSLNPPGQMMGSGSLPEGTVAVDLRKLDPARMNPDEDSAAPAGRNREPIPTPPELMPMQQDMRNVMQDDSVKGEEGWGSLAEQHGFGDNPDHTLWGIQRMPNIAYRGIVPPEAIIPGHQWLDQYGHLLR